MSGYVLHWHRSGNDGFSFDSKTRRPGYTAEDMFQAHILGMDTFTFGLIAVNRATQKRTPKNSLGVLGSYAGK